jgi:hypothetical protein
MSVAVATPQVQPTSMQGIAIPAAVLDKNEFFRRTRRHIQQEKVLPFTLGSSTQDVVSLRKSDILSEVVLHITGSLVITGTTVNSLAAWPYNLIKNVKFSANGASQLISASGWSLRARELAKDEGLTDRGVTQVVGGTSRNQGTLALACESWGVGSNTTALTAGTYAVDLVIVLPVAEDPFDLTGAIFLQSATADLTVEINWAQTADLFTVNTGTVAFSGNCQVLTTKKNIPTANGAGPDDRRQLRAAGVALRDVGDPGPVRRRLGAAHLQRAHVLRRPGRRAGLRRARVGEGGVQRRS